MTTIILTIIGILLAAAAALMVIFYGGDAFNSGSTGALANTVRNASTNVVSAVVLYKAENAGANPTMANLTDSDKYLKGTPTIPNLGNGNPPQTMSTVSGRTMYTVWYVGTAVCDRLNADLGVTYAQAGTSAPTTITASTPKAACAATAVNNKAQYAGQFYTYH